MKRRSLFLLVLAVTAALSLWFVSAAILPEMLREAAVTPFHQALLSSGVQIGFVLGALASAFTGLPDRFDPRKVFAASALLAAAANATLLIAPIGGDFAIAARMATGALLAGVYPVGMKIAVGWGVKDRGLLVGLLVAAVTLGSALPYLIAFGGGAEWRST
ncbi:MAG: MFS transporter, partial [Alphaproteobacteria bacterium]